MAGSISKFYQLRSRLKGLPRDTAWHLGINQRSIKEATGSRILVYHGICLNRPLQFNTLFLTRQAFEAQLRFYKKYFNLVSLDDYYQQSFSTDKFNICLTFDDGFANNYKYVLPLLEQYQVPVTFFITAIRDAGYDILWNDFLRFAHWYGPYGFSFKGDDFARGKDRRYISSATGKPLVDILRLTNFEDKAAMMQVLPSFKNKAPKDYWLQLTKEEIKTLSASKWATIGSHSYYHNDLAKIPITSVKDELFRSKQFLENITGKEIKALAFPYGSYTREVAEEARNAGYSQLLATTFLFPEDATDTKLRERLTINPFISNINQMHANITGNYK